MPPSRKRSSSTAICVEYVSRQAVRLFLRERALGASGLYDEVRAVFALAAARLLIGDTAMRAALEAASTHWLRHGYAHTLVVDHGVPLPVAQVLLGHASVQTTAAYARTGQAGIVLCRLVHPQQPARVRDHDKCAKVV